mmetsp:Transcript_28056/g.61442  ORF Transcript_28056/g.61442 Transcript_28056/m.61442 type:complete len:287 (+) Transcript_28056:1098-1958(+)
MDFRFVGQVPSDERQHVHVRAHHEVEGAVGDVQVGQAGDEVVADEHAHKDEVVDRALHLPLKIDHLRTHVAGEAVAQQLELEVNKVGIVRAGGGARCLKRICAAAAPAATPRRESTLLELLPLSEQRKVRLVRDHAQHNQIGVEAVHAMARLIRRRAVLSHLTNVVHDLVFSLARHLGARKDHLGAINPRRVRAQLLLDPRLVPPAQHLQELGAWRNAVRVERRRLALSLDAASGLECNLLRHCPCRLCVCSIPEGLLLEFARYAVATRSLLVHFCSRSHPINGQI